MRVVGRGGETVLRPENEDHLAEIVRGANAPLGVRGGGTRHAAGGGEALTTAALTGISLYEPGALTLVAGAGTPMAEVEAALAAENQRLAFEPMDHRALLGTTGEPTIGGAVAMNVSGPRRVQAGACRDALIGVRFVDGTGTIVKNGGRVMKNVTGYDLVKLMAGSRGALGVLTEVAFKVLPAAQASVTLMLSGLDVADAVAAMAAGLGSPFDVTGAAHDATARRTVLRIEGMAGSVDYRARRLAEALSPWGLAERVDADPWPAIRDARPVAGEGDVWRVHCRPSHAPRVVAAAGADAALLDWGGGLVWLRLPAGTGLRARLDGIPGHATRVTGSADAPPETPAIAALTDGLRAAFDPRGLFSRPLETA